MKTINNGRHQIRKRMNAAGTKTICLLGICLLLAIQSHLSHAASTPLLSFKDYDSGDELLARLNVLLPVGTPKVQVDRFLITDAKATPLPDPDYPGIYDYIKPMDYALGSDGRRLRHRIWDISVAYKPDGTLGELWVTDKRCSGGQPPPSTDALMQKVWAGINAAEFKNELINSYHPADVTKCWALSPKAEKPKSPDHKHQNLTDSENSH
jgi:hypothetical protein